MKRYSSAACLTMAVLRTIALAAALFAVASVSAQNIPPPDETGPFNVGTHTFSATMTGGRIARIQVFYPTLEPADEKSKYTIETPAGLYQLRSPLGAVNLAQAAPGRFPLVMHDHGGPVAGPDFQRVCQLPLHELMASHGFVTVVALHSNNAAARARDVSLVFDLLLARSADPLDLLAGSIDSARIGVSGHSAGGASAISAAGGWAANGIVADLRIKAMVLYEPGIDSLADARNIAMPYLVMGGTQNRGGLRVPPLFDATTLATPRIYVLTPDAAHFNYLTGMGAEINETREAALLADPSLAEPLTTRTATNAAAARAYDLWNQGELLFAQLGPGAGGGRNYCDRVGVNSVRSLDLDEDGFTDTPPFMADDPFLLRRATREEVMVPIIKQYTVAFWKCFLEGDKRYTPYLTPGHAKRDDLEAVVFKLD